MTYLLLAVGFLTPAALVLALARRRSARDGTRRAPSGRAIAGTVVVLAVMTFVFDNLMIAAGLFGFGEEHLVGVFVGRAPIEDLSYPLFTALLLPALWTLLGRRGGRAEAEREAEREGDAA